MIGSSTYIVKENGHYCAHIGPTYFHFMIADGATARNQTVFQMLAEDIARWGKPDADNLSEKDIEGIVHQRAAHDELWGDSVYLLDLDAKQALVWKRPPPADPMAKTGSVAMLDWYRSGKWVSFEEAIEVGTNA